ncbi:hypothetical protein DQM68_10050 [Leptospira mayottensis]|uniref:Uncharacterized protein n=1 Tax=Leptospira mayottensis TaxID=1137606 RepID=A0ABM6YA16_9LEPT|nr:hypothetical protein DQM68_10050 [Leptospira mayottensis]AXR64848.1 hypothetical protein DQM28_12090 [Leptospira mayottensis]AZQ02588.1 hypothetical protein LEP1GSC190_11635 [Leptospira mayottensis 200901116]TGM96827.1 hypothetical protein EHR03_15055 [Leptospira mayottensis]
MIPIYFHLQSFPNIQILIDSYFLELVPNQDLIVISLLKSLPQNYRSLDENLTIIKYAWKLVNFQKDITCGTSIFDYELTESL